MDQTICTYFPSNVRTLTLVNQFTKHASIRSVHSHLYYANIIMHFWLHACTFCSITKLWRLCPCSNPTIHHIKALLIYYMSFPSQVMINVCHRVVLMGDLSVSTCLIEDWQLRNSICRFLMDSSHFCFDSTSLGHTTNEAMFSMFLNSPDVLKQWAGCTVLLRFAVDPTAGESCQKRWSLKKGHLQFTGFKRIGLEWMVMEKTTANSNKWCYYMLLLSIASQHFTVT